MTRVAPPRPLRHLAAILAGNWTPPGAHAGIDRRLGFQSFGGIAEFKPA